MKVTHSPRTKREDLKHKLRSCQNLKSKDVGGSGKRPFIAGGKEITGYVEIGDKGMATFQVYTGLAGGEGMKHFHKAPHQE